MPPHSGGDLPSLRQFTTQAVPRLRNLRDQTREIANFAVVGGEFSIVHTRTESREIMRSLTKSVVASR